MIYTLLLCWPSVYRLTLPESIGTYLYYVIAYLVPLAAGMLVLFRIRNATSRLLNLLAVLAVLTLSIVTSTSNQNDLGTLFFAIKFYVTPLMLLSLGFYFGATMNAHSLLRILVVVAVGQLLFSLVFYYDVFSNPVYVGTAEFSENWTTTVGVFRAFIGLTLSKFDLAYQVGFLAASLILCSGRFGSHRIQYWFALLISLVTLVFTYNKTMYLIVGLAVLVRMHRGIREHAKWIAPVAVTLGLGGVSYLIVQFLKGELPLEEIVAFLSPQTFWSRVGIWQAHAVFSLDNVFFGMGAGQFTRTDQTMDNQYLFTYLEMGVIGALMYFGLMVSWLRSLSTEAKNRGVFLLFLALIFAIGDMLNALTVMYIIGMFLGIEAGGVHETSRVFSSSYITSERAVILHAHRG